MRQATHTHTLGWKRQNFLDPGNVNLRGDRQQLERFQQTKYAQTFWRRQKIPHLPLDQNKGSLGGVQKAVRIENTLEKAALEKALKLSTFPKIEFVCGTTSQGK